MTRPATARWALSPLDHRAHLLLPDGGHPGVLAAYCGHLLPTVATVHDQPRPGALHTLRPDLPSGDQPAEIGPGPSRRFVEPGDPVWPLVSERASRGSRRWGGPTTESVRNHP